MTAPAQIRVLSDHVANKIAAGEVVERPASVLKELMENALDAGAGRVDVEVTAGGRRLVAVADNGSGMGRDDALLCIERHATSKIRDVDDIERIRTLGFRGEALAAIASVSRFRLVTCRPGQDAGTEIVIVGGKLEDVRDAGAPPGTRVEVRDLFFNVPARRKFLRSHQTELDHLRAAFVLQALAHPAVGMTLKVDGRDVHSLSAGSSLEERVTQLFGPDCMRQLRPLDLTAGGTAVRGYAGVPAAARADRSEQFVFVNGRPTSAPVVNFALREGYHALLPRDRYPRVFLFIETDPALVDVNVHPTKREVRFRETAEVRDGVIAAIRQALSPSAQGVGPSSVPAGAEAAPPRREVQLEIVDLPPVRPFQYPRRVLPDLAAPSGDRGSEPFGPSARAEPGAVAPPAAPADAAGNAATARAGAPWSWCRVVGQVGGLYVVLEIEDGYVLMDPHAAHERVLFEKFLAEVSCRHVASQPLLLPRTVELSRAEASRVRACLGLLKQMGFGISEFGGNAFVLDALPACFGDVAPEPMLTQIAAALEEGGQRAGETRWREETVARAACRSAVKARDRLTIEEVEKLVVELVRTEMPYTCPHGRPTLIFTSFRDLRRKFGRE